ncbi:MAG: hypothetical protein V1702_00435 [Candidatus Woesearchaeota archaeon]
MTSRQEELIRGSSQLRREISELRKTLNQADSQKENSFREGARISQRIKSLISQIKELKLQRNANTAAVKEFKEKRKQLSEIIFKTIEAAKSQRKQRDDLTKKLGIRKPAELIKKEIERLDRKIETEVLSPTKENEIMKVIKEKKKELAAAMTVSTVSDSIRSVSKDINEERKQCDELHKQVQEKAALSQQQHEKMISLSKEVDRLKEEEKKLRETFLRNKDLFSETNRKLQERLLEMNKVSLELGEIQAAEEKEKKQKTQAKIAETEKSLEEKMKRGEKITTQDLINLRGN